jgi:hypothetical protein
MTGMSSRAPMSCGRYLVEESEGHAGAHDAVWISVRREDHTLARVEVLLPLTAGVNWLSDVPGGIRFRSMVERWTEPDAVEALALALDRAATLLREAQ